MTYTDPQLALYRSATPARFAHVADTVVLVLRLSQRKCVGETCDDLAQCRRHKNADATAERLLRLRARRST